MAYYLAGLIEDSGIDPNSADQATIDSLVQQYAPMAEMQIDNWLATVDPSTIQAGGVEPRYECTDQFQCPYRTKCTNDPFSTLNHACLVTNCGSAKCTKCPEWFPDFVKTLILKSWCAYVCIESNVAFPKIVAVGAGGVTHFGNTYGPYCVNP